MHNNINNLKIKIMNNLVLPPDKNSKPIPVLGIGLAQDIADSTYICVEGVLRITAITQSRVWYHNNVKAGSGVFIPEGSSIDVYVSNGYNLEVEGTVNVMNYR